LKVLAADFGGSHATCAIVDDRTLIASEEIAAVDQETFATMLGRVATTFERLTRRESISFKDCKGIALGFAGLVSTKAGRVLSTNSKYEGAPEIDVAEWSRQLFDLPLRIENDARMALLGEVYAGAAQGSTDVVMMTLGTGIGGVAMIEGKLLQGKHSQAGCLGGHIPVLFTGRPCTCGAIGCAESEAAGWSLPLVIAEWPEASQSSLAKYSKVGFKELFSEASAGDQVAAAIRDRCLKIWSATAVGLVHVYDPDIIVIGGGVMKSGSSSLLVRPSDHIFLCRASDRAQDASFCLTMT